jgi:hypothetical protein
MLVENINAIGPNHLWHGPRACMLESNGFIAFAKGADFAEVCKKWQLPPPPAQPAPTVSDPTRVSISPVAHDAQVENRCVPKEQPMDRSSPDRETEVEPELEDVLEGSASPATQATPLSEDQRSWQTDIESRSVSETKQVFSRDQVLPTTFHVLPGSSELNADTMIVLSPVIVPLPRADQTAWRMWYNRTPKSSVRVPPVHQKYGYLRMDLEL